MRGLRTRRHEATLAAVRLGPGALHPADWPAQPPARSAALVASFNKGIGAPWGGSFVAPQVITMTDARLPVVSVSLVLRSGSHASSPDKAGVAGLTAQMLTRGAAGMTAQQLAEDLESRGISLGVDDDGDTTRVSGFATVDQLPHLMTRMKQVLRQPDFPDAEFAKLKNQAVTGLVQSLSQPGTVADREIDKQVYGESSALGRQVEPQALRSLTLDDVKSWYASAHKPQNALLVFSGAIDDAQAKQAASELFQGWTDGDPLPTSDYALAPKPEKLRILLVDNPAGQQANIRMGILGYALTSEDRFAGSVATQTLSSGIENRMDRKLRAEKGLTYGARGYFTPTRHGGAFEVSVDTRPSATAEAITSAFEVIDEMRKADITPGELEYAKNRTAGLMVLQTQTIQQQAGRRIEAILNDWPADYWDHYAERIAQVEASQVRAVMQKYVEPKQFTVVVVAPAKDVKEQLEKLGDVTVIDMPLAKVNRSMAP